MPSMPLSVRLAIDAARAAGVECWENVDERGNAYALANARTRDGQADVRAMLQRVGFAPWSLFRGADSALTWPPLRGG